MLDEWREKFVLSQQEAIEIYTEMHRHLASHGPIVRRSQRMGFGVGCHCCEFPSFQFGVFPFFPQGAKSEAAPKKGFGRRPSQTWQFQGWIPVNAEWQLTTISVKPKELLLLYFNVFQEVS